MYNWAWVRTPLGQEASGGHSVRGHPHRSGFYFQEPHQVLPGKTQERSLWPRRRKGRESLWRGPEPSLEQKLLSKWDCPRAQSWRLSRPWGGIAPLQPFQPSSHWQGKDIHPSGEARVEFTAQGLATNREISSYDCRPLSSPRPMTIGQWCNNHDYRRQSCRIQGLCGETHREAQVQEAPDKGRRGTWSFWHLGPQQTSPGVLPTQMDMEPPINSLFIPVPITQYNTSCLQQGSKTLNISLSDGVYKEHRCNAQGPCNSVGKYRDLDHYCPCVPCEIIKYQC